MRVVLRRIRRPEQSARGSRPGYYRSAAYTPMRPWQVRERLFRLTPLGRRGLDPTEVHDFLDRVAADLDAVYEALARSRQETARIKDALRRWQSLRAETVSERGHD